MQRVRTPEAGFLLLDKQAQVLGESDMPGGLFLDADPAKGMPSAFGPRYSFRGGPDVRTQLHVCHKCSNLGYDPNMFSIGAGQF